MYCIPLPATAYLPAKPSIPRNRPPTCLALPCLPPLQALAEKEGDGMAKMLYRKDTGEILGVHIIGLHAADLIHEASNAIATKQTVQVRGGESRGRVAWAHVCGGGGGQAVQSS